MPAADGFVEHHFTVTIVTLIGVYQHDMQFDPCRLPDDLRYDTCTDSLEYHRLCQAPEILHLLLQHHRAQVRPCHPERFTIFDIALDFLFAKGGNAYLAGLTVQPYIDEGRLYLVEDAPVFSRTAFAIYRTDNENAPLISKLVDTAIDVMKD